MPAIHNVEISFVPDGNGMTYAESVGFSSPMHDGGFGQAEITDIIVEFVIPKSKQSEIANAERLALAMAMDAMSWFGEKLEIRWWVANADYHLKVIMKPYVFSSQYVIAQLDEWYYHNAGYVMISGAKRQVVKR